MKRLFAAIKIHPDSGFLKNYQEMKTALCHEQIKWVEERNIHITLHFFGETEDTKAVLINSVLRKLAEKTNPFSIRLSGFGLFGSSYSPRVIWAGIEPGQTLQAIMKELKIDLGSAGFDFDRQNLVPHLTLGRIKALRDKKYFQRIFAQFKDTPSIYEQINEIILFESKLQNSGPVYSVQQSFILGKKNSPGSFPADPGELQ
ncbi:MAG: RNA 2',3'-cyclic phosphodiesterase [Bacteroidales bacterium]|jgi:2'-5' RNA ligase|nr:RNA 2',3'-cyclic phosphodiesterase [Bacteroidales bacterium]